MLSSSGGGSDFMSGTAGSRGVVDGLAGGGLSNGDDGGNSGGGAGGHDGGGRGG